MTTIVKITEHGTYHYFPRTTHFAVVTAAEPIRSETYVAPNLFALDGEMTPGSPYGRTQYVRESQFTEEGAAEEWASLRPVDAGNVASPTEALYVGSRPTTMGSFEAEWLVSWTNDGVDDMPRTENPVDDTIRMLDRVHGIQIDSSLSGVKDYVGLAMRIKRRNLGYNAPTERHTKVFTVDMDGDKILLLSPALESTLIANGWGTPGDREEATRTLADLTAQVATVREQKRAAEQAHENDIALIGERLQAEAEQRNWCSEYDDVVEGLNRSLTKPLPVRSRTYTGNVSGYIRIPFSVSVSVEVDRGSEDDVAEAIQAEFESTYDSARSLQYDIDWYDAEIEDAYEVDDVEQA